MKEKRINMLEGPIIKPMISFVIPILLTGVLQQLFNTVDVVLAGRLGTSGDNAVAAVGSTTAILSLLVNFFAGCAAGSAVAVSHAVGSKNKQEIEKTLHTAMLLSLVIGAIITVIGLFFARPILELIDTPKEIIDQASAYLQARFTGQLPLMFYYYGSSILRVVGETKKPLEFLMVSGPVKIVLTIVFVSFFKLDVVGLALATTCSQIVSALMLLSVMLKRDDELKLDLKKLKFHAKPLKKILYLGIPSGIQTATFSLSNVIIQSSTNSLAHLKGFITGDAAARSIEAFGEIFTSSFYQVALGFVGTNVGADNYKRVKKCHIYANLLSIVSVVSLGAVVLCFARQLLGIYITNSPQAIEWGIVRLSFFFIPLCIQAIMDATPGTLRGMGISISSTVISLSSICGVRILWCITIFQIPQFHNPYMLYLIYPISWLISAIAQNIVFMIHYKKKTVT